MNEKLTEIKLRENPNDEIYTPPSLARDLIKQVDIKEGQSCLDPFYGTGAFYDNFPSMPQLHDFCEINLGKDFFKEKRKFDWIISNPPFSQLTNIFTHTIDRCNVGFAYLIPAYSLTCHRIRTCNNLGFYINKIIHFRNPKSWNIGFQMIFVIFTRNKNDSFVNLESCSTVQRRLFDDL